MPRPAVLEKSGRQDSGGGLVSSLRQSILGKFQVMKKPGETSAAPEAKSETSMSSIAEQPRQPSARPSASPASDAQAKPLADPIISPAVHFSGSGPLTGLQGVAENETAATKQSAAEDGGSADGEIDGNLRPSPRADYISHVGPDLKKPNSQDTSSQTPADTIKTSLHDDDDPSAGLPALNATIDPPDTRPSTLLEETQEHGVHDLWSLALRHLQGKLSIEEVVSWLNACGMSKLSQGSPRASKEITDRTGGKIISGPSLLADYVHSIAGILRSGAVLDEDEEEHKDDDDTEEDNVEQYEDMKEDDRSEEDEQHIDDEDYNDLSDSEARSSYRNRTKMPMKTKTPKQIIAAALRAHPYASIAWVVSYITLECLSDAPSLKNEDTYAQIASVLGKTEGYARMFRLVFRAGKPGPVDALVALYESILMFHIQAAIKIAQQQPGQQINLQGEINDIAARMDTLIASLDLLDLQSQVSALCIVPTKTAMEVLRVTDPNRMQRANIKNWYILKRLFTLASERQTFKGFINEGEASCDRQILWIRGSPGVGKTTLLQAIVQTFHKSMLDEDKITTRRHVAFFFRWRHVDDEGDNNIVDFALDAVKNLIYNVLLSQPRLQHHFTDMLKADYAARDASERYEFDAPGDFAAMSMLLYRIVQDDHFEPTYFVLDGIDEELDPAQDQHQECLLEDESDLARLLGLMATTTQLSNRVKWVLSADCERWTACREMLNLYATKAQYQLLDLDTELVQEDIVQVARDYAGDSVVKMSSNASAAGYQNDHVRRSLLETLNKVPLNNFLWTDMALLSIVQTSTMPWNAASALEDLATNKSTVVDLYDAALSFAFNLETLNIRSSMTSGAAHCKVVLVIAAAVYRPLTMSELVALSELPPAVDLSVLVDTLLPTFLTISDDGIVRYTHTSGRDYIKRNHFSLLWAKDSAIHSEIARRCLALVLKKVGCSCDHFANHNHHRNDNFGRIDYDIYMWIKHLSEPSSKDNGEALTLAVHLLGVHLEEWLALLGFKRNTILRCLCMMRRLHTSVAAKAGTQQPPQNEHNLHSVPDSRTTAQVIREVITVMQKHQCNLLDEKDVSWKGTTSYLNNWLLFAADLPHLRRNLLSAKLPWIVTSPRIDPTDSLTSCFHVITHRDWVRGCCFSPDSRLVASACDDERVRLWDAQTGNLQLCFDPLSHYVLGVAMSPRATMGGPKEIGATLLAAFTRHSIKAWDVTSGELVFSMNDLKEALNQIALSPEGDKLAAATTEGLIVWKDFPPPPQQQQQPATGDEPIFYSTTDTKCVTFSPDGNLIASAEGARIRIWDASGSREEICNLPITTPDSEPSQQEHEDGYDQGGEELNEEPGQSELGPGDDTNTESQNDGEQERESMEAREDPDQNSVEEEYKTPSGHTDNINWLDFSPDSNFLVSGSDDRTARVWDMRMRETVVVLAYHKRHVNSVSFSPDGSCIATGSSDGTVAIWKHKSLGNWGVAGNLRNGDGGEEKTELEIKPETRTWPDRILYGHKQPVLAVAFAPPSTSTVLSSSSFMLAASSIDTELRIWDIDIATHDTVDTADAGDPVTNSDAVADTASADRMLLKGHRTSVCCVAVSPKSNVIVTASYDGMLCFWDGMTGAQLCCDAREKGHETEVLVMAFSSDGVLLVTAAKDGVVFVWNVSSLSPADVLLSPLVPRYCLSHDDWVRDAVFDRESLLVATASDDGKARIFDVSGARSALPEGSGSSAEPICPQKSFDARVRYLYVYCVAFSPDRKRLAAGGDDGCLRIWRLDGDDCTDALDYVRGLQEKETIVGVVYSDDGNKVVSVSEHGLIAVWTWAGGRPAAVAEPREPGRSGEPVVPAPLQYRIVQKGFPRIGYRVPFRRMRFDSQNYPGVVFTEHGPACVELEKDAMPVDDEEDDDETTYNNKEEKNVSKFTSRWGLPPGGVYGRSIMWNGHVIDLPEHMEVTDEPFSWCVQDRVLVVGTVSGQVLLFRFKDDANPKLRAVSEVANSGGSSR